LQAFSPIVTGLGGLGIRYGVFKALAKGEGIPVAAMLSITTGLISVLLGVICDQIAALRLERYAHQDEQDLRILRVDRRRPGSRGRRGGFCWKRSARKVNWVYVQT
jgi:hypothetical protein